MTTTPSTSKPNSQLVPVGVLFMIIGLLGRQPLAKVVIGMEPSTLRGLLYVVATDGLTLLFMAGVTCALIGWLRKNKARRLSQN